IEGRNVAMDLLPADPEQLVALARAGNGPALGQLLESYRSYLALLARLQIGRRLQGKVDAADLVQETFVAAPTQVAEFKVDGEVLILHHLQGLSLPEVAQRLGRTLDSVKNIWLRALARLRQVVGEAP